jgi:Flp pilus assembly protein TadG
MKSQRRTTHSARRRGVAATELGLVLPLLMMIVLGAIDFGRFAYAYIAVTNAARAGAGFGILHPYTATSESTWRANVRSAAVDELRTVIDGSTFTDDDVTVTTSRVIESDGLQRITVTVAFPFQTLVPWPGIPNRVPLTRPIVMRVIR